MRPGKSLQVGLKVYGLVCFFVVVVVGLFFCQARLKNHPSQVGFCMEFAVEECH